MAHDVALLRRVDELAADGLRDEESWIGVKSKVLYRVVWYVVPTLRMCILRVGVPVKEILAC